MSVGAAGRIRPVPLVGVDERDPVVDFTERGELELLWFQGGEEL